VNSFRSYRELPTTSSHDASASLSLPYSFEEGHGVRLDRKVTNERIINDDGGNNGSYYSRRQRGPRRDARSLDGSSYTTYSYRDPRDIPFRTQKDPSVVSSSSISSRMQSSRTLESPSLKSATSRSNGRQQRGSVRSHSPESKGSTIGMSTIPSTAGDSSLASTCSTITMDTSFRKNRRRKNNNNNKKHRQFSSGLDPVREGDSRGRDPEESGSSRDGSSGVAGNGKPHIPTQVNVPREDKGKIVLIANLPQDIGKDQDGSGVMDNNEEVVSRRMKRDDVSSRGENNHDMKKRNSRDTAKSSRRKGPTSRDEQGYGHNNRSSHRSLGDASSSASYISQPSMAASHTPSVRSQRSRDANRIDIDPDGYCSRHPTIRLMKPDERDNSYWSIVRKKCPACLREDCPSVFGEERSVRSNYTNGTMGEYTMYSVESSKGSSFFMPSMLTPEEIEEEEDTRRLKRRLAARAYHFPGNTWCEDWFQYISNTHTVLGLFFHHPLHPLKLQERLVILFGSIAIGLTISNLTYMHFIKIGIDIDEELFRVNLSWMGMSEIIITKLMITLWTLGSFLHTVFDLGLWHMKACTLCRYGGQIDDRMARWGRVIGLLIVTIAMAAGSYAVLLRASIEYKGEESEGSKIEEAIRNNEFYEIDIGGKRSFRFLLGYLVEFLLAMFVYYPLAVTVIFSGVLGCRGRIPILGGRPREIKKERNYAMRKRKMLEAEAADEEDETSDVYADEYSDAFPEDANSASYKEDDDLESRVLLD